MTQLATTETEIEIELRHWQQESLRRATLCRDAIRRLTAEIATMQHTCPELIPILRNEITEHQAQAEKLDALASSYMDLIADL